mgnify:FL=1
MSNSHPSVHRLFEAAEEQRTTIMDISRKAGVAASTICGWRRGNMPKVDNLDACLRAIGLRVVVVPEDDLDDADRNCH